LGAKGERREHFLQTIIYKDVSKEEDLKVNAVLLRLGERVCNSLNFIGYSFCKGNIMAKNHKWCQPLSAWQNYFIEWITAPEPQNLLDATVFFDFRSVYGDEIITEDLRKDVMEYIRDNQLFLYHLDYNTFITKHPHISSGNILSDRNADMIDLKSAVSPIIMFTRSYSLQNGIISTNTIDRLNALKERHILPGDTVDEIIYTYNYLMKLRFRNHAELLRNHSSLNNSLNTKGLIEPELILLKKVLSYIPEYQNKIKTDFRITT
jgi:CBS domain-containing protein